MTPEMKSRLFLLNEKTRGKGTEGEPSTGLGLLLAKNLLGNIMGEYGLKVK